MSNENSKIWIQLTFFTRQRNYYFLLKKYIQKRQIIILSYLSFINLSEKIMPIDAWLNLIDEQFNKLAWLILLFINIDY